ncbi:MULTISPECIES: carbohydrate kinase family protein [Mesorhizobium]|uniref:Carbohydrate kinase n=1 Tax=Mesorhizobium denitrificans TaxID=2294114 RepID=A0A371XFR0_9HYPH|nr:MULTISPECIES: carbohydrate kinase family protein [Mesorhizobium]RFC68023.1 carbohydrate kinase [Mesorhizobium denitrificans]
MRLIGIGGGHIDRRGQIAGDYVPAASNPGRMLEDIGGGALNALRNAVQRGQACTFVSVRGGDSAGEQVSRAISDAGIADLSATFLDRTTPSYTALLDRHGDLIAGFADMGLYDLAFPKQLRRSTIRHVIATQDAVLCDANIPAIGLERLAALSEAQPIFAIAVSPAKVVRLRTILANLACLFMNITEARVLAASADISAIEAAQVLRSTGLQAGVITSGGGELILFDEQGAFSLQPPPPTRLVDVTGAGDALAGVTISALLEGSKFQDAVRQGVAAALLTLESGKAVSQLEPDSFAKKLALVPQARQMA